MNSDELRALADALSRQRQADEHGIYCAVPRQAVDAAIKYLRACADAQPVRAVPIGHALSAVRHVGSANYPDRERAAIERLYSAEFDAYAHPAPAAPEIKERGPWTDRHTSVQAWIESDDFTHDVRLYVNGDFESNDQRIAYAQEIARRLNAAPIAPAGWKLVPVEPTPEMLSAVGMMDGYDWHAPGCSPDADHANWYSAMIAAAPAAPQAEPIDPHMIVAEDRFPDVPAERWKPCPQCGEDFDRECPICDGLGRVLATDGEQAEPKREPLTALRILEIEDDANRKWRDNGRIIEYAVVFARMIERAHGIGGSDE